MKTKQILKIIPVVFTLSSALAQTAAERLEQGVQLQSTEKNYTAAIAEYKEVLKAGAKSERLAAEARFRLVECFSELGNDERAKHHLEALRAGFAADNKWVVKAAAMGPKDWNFEGSPWEDEKLHTYEVKLPNGVVLGHYMMASRLLNAEARRWEVSAIRSAGGKSVCRTVFNGDSYEAESARWVMDVLGDITMKFGEKGMVKIVDSWDGSKKGLYDHGKSENSQVPMFENEQMMQVIRALKQEVGTKQKSIICVGINGGVSIPFNLEVTGHEEIETTAGKFSCVKIESSIKPVYYVSRGEKRELVRIDMGEVRIDLTKTEDWNVNEPKKLRSREFGATVELPGAMCASPPNVDEEVYRVQLWSSDFAGTWGLLEINKKSNLLPEARKGSREYAKVLHEGFKRTLGGFEVGDQWDEIEVNGVTAVGMKVNWVGMKGKEKKGELTTYAYQVHAVGDEAAMSFRLEYAKPDEERAIARAKEIVEGFRW